MPLTVPRAQLNAAIGAIQVLAINAKDQGGVNVRWFLPADEAEKAICAMLSGLTPSAHPDSVLPDDIHSTKGPLG